MKSLCQHFIFICLFTLSMLGTSPNAQASDKASATGAAPVARLEPFIVNLASFDRYLQAILTLQVGAAEVSDKIKSLMPVVRHTIILTLSSKAYEDVHSAQGKKELVEELKSKLNKVLELKENDGVNDIYFENFVIQ